MAEIKEIVIPLPDGRYLCCGEGEEHYFGGYVLIRDKDLQRTELYWDSNEWKESPEEVMGAIFGAACLKSK